MQENLNKETVIQQFNIVKKETNTSHVTEWGDAVSRFIVIVLVSL